MRTVREATRLRPLEGRGSVPVGAYGFRVDHRIFGTEDLHEAGEHWPELATTCEGRVPHGWPSVISGPGWTVHVEPGGAAAHLVGSGWAGNGTWPDPATRIHPLLSLLALAATLTRGGDSLHAGGVLTRDGVVALLARAGGGKTSTVAWLALHAGAHAFTDDNLLVQDGLARAGPRALDLRPAAASALGLEHCTSAVRGDDRRRLRPEPPGRLSAPVIRTVVLAWAPQVLVEVVPPSRRLAVLAAQRTAQPFPGRLTVPLDLAAVPMLKVSRPRSFECMPAVATAILTG